VLGERISEAGRCALLSVGENTVGRARAEADVDGVGGSSCGLNCPCCGLNCVGLMASGWPCVEVDPGWPWYAWANWNETGLTKSEGAGFGAIMGSGP
jgi:hypothetical protein